MTQGTLPPIADEDLGRIRAEAMDFACIGLYRYRFDGTIVFFDVGALRLLDLTDSVPDPASLVGKNIGTLLQYVDPPGRLRDAVRSGKQIRNFEYRYRTLSGKTRWVYHNSYLVTDPDTGEEQIQVIAQDITPLKETARALAASERRYRVLAEQSLHGIGVVSLGEGRFVFVNPALTRLLGESQQTLLGMTFGGFLEQAAQEADCATLRAELMGVAEGKAPSTLRDVRILRSDGELRWVTPLFAPIEIDGHAAVQITFIDSTERWQAEERRRLLESRMRHTQKLESLGVLAGGIAHDFNNLLAGILGNTDLATRRLGDEGAVRVHLEEIRKSSRRAAELCRQLLAYSGRYRMASESMDINHLIRDTAELLKLSVSKKASLEIRLHPVLPLASGDPSQIKQVLMNLIINASEAIGDRPGTINLQTDVEKFERLQLDSAYCGRERSEGRYIVIEVQDDGVGMDEATRDRIFEPFFTTKFTGRGLGLAAVLGIIQGHEGALFVDSAPQRGTRFRVLLPPLDEAHGAGARQPDSGPLWRGHGTVLVVDDEEAIRTTAQEMLEELGFQALTASDGRAAVQVLRAHQRQVSLVLLDVLMPQFDGRECFRAIRAARPDVPVLFNSGYGEDAVADLVAGEERVSFLQKPYGLRALSVALRGLLAHR